MFLNRNRFGRAWFVWIPVVLIQTPIWAVKAVTVVEIPCVFDAYGALAFAFGVLWLLMPYLSEVNRRAKFLCSFLLLLTGTCIFGIGTINPTEEIELLIFLLYVGFNSALAFGLALWSFRKKQTLGAFIAWLSLWTGVLWGITTLPVLAFAISEAGMFVVGALTLAAIAGAAAFGVTIAFIVLSVVEPFYRGRLESFLGIKLVASRLHAPPVISGPS